MRVDQRKRLYQPAEKATMTRAETSFTPFFLRSVKTQHNIVRTFVP